MKKNREHKQGFGERIGREVVYGRTNSEDSVYSCINLIGREREFTRLDLIGGSINPESQIYAENRDK